MSSSALQAASGGLQRLKLLDVSGAGFERGRQHAAQAIGLRPTLLAAIELRLAGLRASMDGRAHGELDEWRAVVADEAPDFAAEVEGLAAGFDLDLGRFWQYTAAGYLADRQAARVLIGGDEGCSVVAIGLPDRGPVLAKNRDYLGSHRALQSVSRVRPENGRAHVVVTSVGSPGAFSSGMNDAGLAVADAHVPTTDIGPGLPSNALMSAVLARCGSVAEAIDVVRSSTRAGGCNLVVADAHGRAAVIEVGHAEIAVRDGAPACAATNHFQGDGPRSSPGGEGVEDTTWARYETIERGLPTLGHLDELSGLLARHDVGPMCQHRADGGGTISSAIYVLRERRLLVTAGPPCVNARQEIAL